MNSGAAVVVRPSAPEDARRILDLWDRSWHETYADDTRGITHEWIDEVLAPRRTPEEIARFERRIRAAAQRIPSTELVAEVDGVVVGMMHNQHPAPDSDDEQRIIALYVDREFHGAAVGAALMRHALEEFDAARSVRVGVSSSNARAIAFYRKWGFVEVTGSARLYLEKIEEITMRRPAEQPSEEAAGDTGKIMTGR